MSKIHREYTVTATTLKKLIGWGFSTNCDSCRKPFEIGQKMVCRLANHRTKHYHKSCWEEKFHGD